MAEALEFTLLAHFRNPVPRDGFQWVTGHTLGGDQEGLYLVGSPDTCSDGPLESGLFRTFAQTATDSAGVLDFANEYGCLGGSAASMGVQARGERRRGWKPGLVGERLEVWQAEIRVMRRLVHLLDLLKDENAGGLKRFVKWASVDAVRYESSSKPPDGFREVIASAEVRPEVLATFKPPDVLRPARWYLQVGVNGKLAEHAVHGRLVSRNPGDAPRFALVPTNLIGFLWLQFAMAIDAGVLYRQCEGCTKWFALGFGAARADKRFCSPTCKARSHRKQKEGKTA